jgi:cytochrome c oxidase assembly protein subunit 15
VAGSGLRRLAWSVLGWNVAVVVWGAYVRASGSGAGCGSHWPLCDGQVIPRAPSVAQAIEYTHRVTSGLALVAVLALVVAAFRARPKGHPVRRAAIWSLVFILLEAALGAGLVLFELVADNASRARALGMAAHLVNTFFLLAALALTARAAADRPWPVLRRKPLAAAAWLGLLGLIALAGSSGAVAALGDTLFPSRTLAEALAQDLSPTTHLLLRLRIAHPAVAGVAAAAALLLGARWSMSEHDEPRRWGRAVVVLALLQVGAGIANVVLLAPIPLQLVHLAVADLLWISSVLAGAADLAGAPGPSTASGAAA